MARFKKQPKPAPTRRRRSADGDDGQQRIESARADRAFTTLRQTIAKLEAKNAALRERIGLPTDWDRFKDLYVKTTAAAVFVLGCAYVWMDATQYPYPGKKFWGHEQINNAMTIVLGAALAIAGLRPMLAWTLGGIAACLFFALLFR